MRTNHRPPPSIIFLLLVSLISCFSSLQLWGQQHKPYACHELTLVLLRSGEDIFQKFSLPLTSLTPLRSAWQKLSWAEQQVIAEIFHYLPPLSIRRSLWHLMTPKGELSVLRVLTLIIEQRGNIDQLLLKALLSPHVLNLDEARTLYLMLYHQWWFAGRAKNLRPVNFYLNQQRNLISRKLMMILDLPSASNLPRQLLHLLGPDEVIKPLLNRHYYLQRFLLLLQTDPLIPSVTPAWDQLGLEIERALAGRPETARSSWQYQELANLQWLIQHRHENISSKSTLAQLPMPLPWATHFRLWWQQHPRPTARTIIKIYLLGLLLEQMVVNHHPPAADAPPATLETLKQQYHQGQITREQFLQRAAQLIFRQKKIAPQ